MHDLRDVSGSILDQVANLTNKFEEQASALVNTTRIMEATNNRLEGTAEERRAMLASNDRGNCPSAPKQSKAC
ncbi:hypothetical protein [uncultured Cohaesibacter sp.]|uniref:hypothetical protein n=1 Tax=uncultured Cohaesibacter sp. TaxID=1002546 RepID=UPI0029C87CC0|nr:hypothetical protein [uncultured Cohaesibacter sp.]